MIFLGLALRLLLSLHRPPLELRLAAAAQYENKSENNKHIEENKIVPYTRPTFYSIKSDVYLAD